MEFYTSTERIVALDMDGGTLAVFHGYDAPEPRVYFQAELRAMRLMCYDRSGNIKQTYWK